MKQSTGLRGPALSSGVAATTPALRQLATPLAIWGVVAFTVLTLARVSFEAVVIHACFLAAFVAALALLGRPLIDPLQFVACLFYWWLGVGPLALTAVGLATSGDDPARFAEDAVPAVAIAVCGLLGYASAAALGARLVDRLGCVVRGLGPEGDSYTPKEAGTVWLFGILAAGAIPVLAAMGVQGIEAVNFLGGKKTGLWWVGVIDALSLLRLLGLSALISYVFAAPGRWRTGAGALAAVALGQAVGSSVLSGWKAGMVVPLAICGICWVSRRRSIPWLAILVLGLAFLLFVEPFVAAGRLVAQQASAATPDETRAILLDYLRSDATLISPRQANAAALFRGIAPLASEITRRSSLLSGPWGGDTWLWAGELVVPRALHPAKGDGSVANFFARELGVDLGVTASGDTETGLAVTLLFEAVGNFGWLFGVILFAAVALLWGGFCAAFLSPSRLATHPFTAVVCLQLGVVFEGSLAAFLPAMRDFLLVLGLLFFVRRVIKN